MSYLATFQIRKNSEQVEYKIQCSIELNYLGVGELDLSLGLGILCRQKYYLDAFVQPVNSIAVFKSLRPLSPLNLAVKPLDAKRRGN